MGEWLSIGLIPGRMGMSDVATKSTTGTNLMDLLIVSKSQIVPNDEKMVLLKGYHRQIITLNFMKQIHGRKNLNASLRRRPRARHWRIFRSGFPILN